MLDLPDGWGDLSEMALPGGLPQPGRVFRYESWAADAETGTLTCRYSLDGREFTERVTLPPGPRWRTGAARAAARLVFLLAGVSYYKTAAPPVIDLGQTALTEAELASSASSTFRAWASSPTATPWTSRPAHRGRPR